MAHTTNHTAALRRTLSAISLVEAVEAAGHVDPSTADVLNVAEATGSYGIEEEVLAFFADGEAARARLAVAGPRLRAAR